MLAWNWSDTRHRSPALDTARLGHLAFWRLLESLVDAGVTTLECPPGHAETAVRFGGVRRAIRHLVIAANDKGTRRRMRSFKRRERELDGLHQVWRDVVCPFLRRPQTPPWPILSRSRLRPRDV